MKNKTQSIFHNFLEKNHKVIVLDDERLKYGELFIDTFWELEKEFLKTWGREREIAPLKNLDEYLLKKHVNKSWT